MYWLTIIFSLGKGGQSLDKGMFEDKERTGGMKETQMREAWQISHITE